MLSNHSLPGHQAQEGRHKNTHIKEEKINKKNEAKMVKALLSICKLKIFGLWTVG